MRSDICLIYYKEVFAVKKKWLVGGPAQGNSSEFLVETNLQILEGWGYRMVKISSVLG